MARHVGIRVVPAMKPTLGALREEIERAIQDLGKSGVGSPESARLVRASIKDGDLVLIFKEGA